MPAAGPARHPPLRLRRYTAPAARGRQFRCTPADGAPSRARESYASTTSAGAWRAAGRWTRPSAKHNAGWRRDGPDGDGRARPPGTGTHRAGAVIRRRNPSGLPPPRPVPGGDRAAVGRGAELGRLRRDRCHSRQLRTHPGAHGPSRGRGCQHRPVGGGSRRPDHRPGQGAAGRWGRRHRGFAGAAWTRSRGWVRPHAGRPRRREKGRWGPRAAARSPPPRSSA